MLSPSVCALLALAAADAAFEARTDRLDQHFGIARHWARVRWHPADAPAADSCLDIGYAGGTGPGLGWLRFRPGPGGVDVLRIELADDARPYRTKWPPDRAPVAVARARMTSAAYADLLVDIATITAARLGFIEAGGLGCSPPVWASVQLGTSRELLVYREWAGSAAAGREAIRYAVPMAAVGAAREGVRTLRFEQGEPTAEDRAWVSAKYARDMKRFARDADTPYWLPERYTVVVGAAGDRAALPALRAVLEADPGKGRVHYFAVNAVTRLTGTDVRERPVEAMDLDAVVPKVLALIRNAK